MNCNYCLCKTCKYYEDCEPCRGDYDYEHPCAGECEDFEETFEHHWEMMDDIEREEYNLAESEE